jgi:hypothetical protein
MMIMLHYIITVEQQLPLTSLPRIVSNCDGSQLLALSNMASHLMFIQTQLLMSSRRHLPPNNSRWSLQQGVMLSDAHVMQMLYQHVAVCCVRNVMEYYTTAILS